MKMHHLCKLKHAFIWCVCLMFSVAYSSKTDGQGLIETMTAQLAKLELYLHECQQGYNIVQQGLGTINNIKRGDIDIHSLFFSSFLTVNPAIKSLPKVNETVQLQANILTACSRDPKEFSKSGAFSNESLQVISNIYANVKSLTDKDIIELYDLLKDQYLQMTDEDRMHRIDLIYQSVRDKFLFVQSFTRSVQQDGLRRLRERTELLKLKKLIQP